MRSRPRRGIPCPDDLRRRANGQPDNYCIALPALGTLISPVFGAYGFMTCANALPAYRSGPRLSRGGVIR